MSTVLNFIDSNYAKKKENWDCSLIIRFGMYMRSNISIMEK